MSDEVRLSPNEIAVISKAITHIRQEGTYLLSFVGMTRQEDTRGMDVAASLLMRQEGVETVLVTGVVDSTTLHGVIKTRSGTVEVTDWVNDMFEESGVEFQVVEEGGSKNNQTFVIPLGLMGRTKDREALKSLVDSLVTNRFLEKVGKVE